MALQTEHGLSHLEQPAVGRAVRVMTGDTVLGCRRVLHHIGTAYTLMTGGALGGLGNEAHLVAAMGIMAADTGQSPFLEGMMGGHV